MEDECGIITKNETTQAFREASPNDCVLPENLTILDDEERYIFMGIFVVFSVLSLCGNCAAIYSISRRKYRYVQKTCIVSLAVSDILSTIVIAANNLETFSHRIMVWTMGSFLCSVIPMLQMAGITASSLALMFIAMDRYRTVVHALGRHWNPRPSTCVSAALILWITVLLASYPLYHFFSQAPVTIVYAAFKNQTPSFTYESADVCVSFDKANMKVYYIVMVIVIFLPLLLVFLWFYYSIASLVWKHRKPVAAVLPHESSASSTSQSEVRIRNVNMAGRGRDLKVERKIRTFKVIVTLMLVFIVCRLPYFTVYILKMSLDDYGIWTWYLNYSFVALHIVNCCLNPLLYTFLNPTLTVWIRVKKSAKDFVWEICCFCFSKGEFDEFEKENPFGVNEFDRSRGNSKVKFEENAKEIQAKY